MALIERYRGIQRGRMILTGNTFILNRPETIPQLGPFTSVDTSLVDPPSPPGTTRDWRLSSSMAVLTIPATSTVVRAELTWTSRINDGTTDVSAFKDDPVTFITPLGTTTVAPQATFPASGSPLYYARSADVTALVSAGRSGQYIVGKVAGLNGYEQPANGAGWFLSVVVFEPSDPVRLFQINMGLEDVPPNSSLNFSISGFSTPSTGTVTGDLFMGVIRGDAGVDIITIFVGPNPGSLTQQLKRPPLPDDNMMIGIISNTVTGAIIDTSGTFGNNNNTLVPPTNEFNARAHTDIARFNISPSLTNSQTSLTTQSTSTGDAATFTYAIYDLQIDVFAPEIIPRKLVNTTAAIVGDTLTYTISFRNTGNFAADNVIVTDIIPAGTTFVANSVTVNGITQPGAVISSGVNVGTVVIGELVTLTFQVVITTPAVSSIENTAQVEYTFIPVAGEPPVSITANTNTVNTAISTTTRGILF